MPDLANKNTGHPVQGESQINSKYFFMQYVLYSMWDTLILSIVFVV